MNLLKRFFVLTGVSILFWGMTSCGSTETNATDTQHTDITDASADTVNIPSLVRANAEGLLYLTANNGKAIGPDIKYMPEWKAFGWFTAADRVEWEVEVPQTAGYSVFLEWSVDDAEAGKEFLFEAKSAQLTGIVGKSGSWETYKTEDVGNINLTEGKQTMVFKSKTQFDKGAILDFRQIKLVPVK